MAHATHPHLPKMQAWTWSELELTGLLLYMLVLAVMLFLT